MIRARIQRILSAPLDAIISGPDSATDGPDVSCDDVLAAYEAVLAASRRCSAAGACHVLEGHCSVGLGDCYYGASTDLEQAALDAIADLWVDRGCMEGMGVCDCSPPPSVRCDAGGCLTF